MAFAWIAAIQLVDAIWGFLMGKVERSILDEKDLIDKVAKEREKIMKSKKKLSKASKVDIVSSDVVSNMFMEK
jgi:hypothetical protein